ncbi:nitroreductase/quinone reductase family protein [Streptomyces sp. NBC_00094]|uniref:nitroreductase/quinone reductase family protein n=1 Tax=Streptomyces sp. NBC_00094 TaxID=2903620 RepID=UPI002252B9FA|nr:nitroreductase/quinone reductase family protein [Streptomyces sp. NBC_00094]MCX5388724.1 nitroreductase family deazaflavin-dependent oxidoreductase [Streptomyces sp. NBC_00094]
MAASNAGGPKHPAWFHNLRADAHVSVEIGTAEGAVEHFRATAVVAEREERGRMREEHQGVARTVEELETLLASSGAPEALRAEVDRLAARLERHFAYEEAHLLPVLTPQSR